MQDTKKQVGEKNLLHHLGDFSRKMVNNHHLENLSEFVLHDLCSEKGFNIRKSAYLVNNPDFNCMKGVAGYYHPESFDKGLHWNNQKDFTAHMNGADFNQKVRTYSDNGASYPSKISDKQLEELVKYFAIDNPAYHVWNSKHNNQGVFIFESPDNNDIAQDHLLNFLHMLSFCPVF